MPKTEVPCPVEEERFDYWRIGSLLLEDIGISFPLIVRSHQSRDLYHDLRNCLRVAESSQSNDQLTAILFSQSGVILPNLDQVSVEPDDSRDLKAAYVEVQTDCRPVGFVYWFFSDAFASNIYAPTWEQGKIVSGYLEQAFCSNGSSPRVKMEIQVPGTRKKIIFRPQCGLKIK